VKKAIWGAVVTLLITGCSGGADYSKKQFGSVNELATAVSAVEGWSCMTDQLGDETHTREALALYGWASGTCSAGSLAIYGSDAKRSELASNEWNALLPGKCRLDGGNWSVWGQQYAVEAAQKKMSGELTCG
jgi:hypothetical protein